MVKIVNLVSPGALAALDQDYAGALEDLNQYVGVASEVLAECGSPAIAAYIVYELLKKTQTWDLDYALMVSGMTLVRLAAVEVGHVV